jgi:hypothetical protein
MRRRSALSQASSREWMAGVFPRRAPQRTALAKSENSSQPPQRRQSTRRDLQQGTGRSTRPARAATPAILFEARRTFASRADRWRTQTIISSQTWGSPSARFNARSNRSAFLGDRRRWTVSISDLSSSAAISATSAPPVRRMMIGSQLSATSWRSASRLRRALA